MHKPGIKDDFIRAQQLLQEGKLPHAEGVLKRLLRTMPDSPVVLRCMGMTLFQQGRLDEAEDYMRRAIELKEEYPEALNDLGCILLKAGDHDGALAVFKDALKLMPSFAELWHNAGGVYTQRGEFDEAVDAYRRASELQPNRSGFCVSLGCAVAAQGRLDDAVSCMNRAAQLGCPLPDAYAHMAKLLASNSMVDEDVVAVFRQAVETQPPDARNNNNLGYMLSELGRYGEADEQFHAAIKLDPNSVNAQCNLAACLHRQGKLDQSLAVCDRAIEINPKWAGAHLNRAFTLLLQGEYEQGWQEYSWRFRCKPWSTDRRHYSRRIWDGESIKGKRVLLFKEQGFGDTLQFVRYAKNVAGRGGHVILQCQDTLAGLLAGVDGVAEVVPAGSGIPEFDVYSPLASLPAMFKTTIETIPADVPYISAAPADTEAWRERLGQSDRMRVGIVWSGNPGGLAYRQNRLPVDVAASLLDVEGAEFYSLQVGASADDISQLDQDKIIDLSPHLTDFSQTAAAIGEMDLVISVDTSVVHLAGAMGKDVWVLLAAVPDWRWMLDRTDSPWYPTARLFRQKNAGDWGELVGRLRGALDERICKRDV